MYVSWYCVDVSSIGGVLDVSGGDNEGSMMHRVVVLEYVWLGREESWDRSGICES